MTRSEYSAPYIYGGFDTMMAELGALGRDGWEVFQIQGQCHDGGQRVFLKRMLRPPDPPILVPAGIDLRPGAVNRVD